MPRVRVRENVGARINKVIIVHGSDLKYNWKKPMQVVFTGQGIFIDNEPGTKIGGWRAPDWSMEVDKLARFNIVADSDHMWIEPLKVELDEDRINDTSR